jgi:hypothetical protein
VLGREIICAPPCETKKFLCLNRIQQNCTSAGSWRLRKFAVCCVYPANALLVVTMARTAIQREYHGRASVMVLVASSDTTSHSTKLHREASRAKCKKWSDGATITLNLSTRLCTTTWSYNHMVLTSGRGTVQGRFNHVARPDVRPIKQHESEQHIMGYQMHI